MAHTGKLDVPDAGRLGALPSAVKDEILDQRWAAYDGARTIWNAMIDRQPGLIIRCQEQADVTLCLAEIAGASRSAAAQLLFEPFLVFGGGRRPPKTDR